MNTISMKRQIKSSFDDFSAHIPHIPRFYSLCAQMFKLKYFRGNIHGFYNPVVSSRKESIRFLGSSGSVGLSSSLAGSLDVMLLAAVVLPATAAAAEWQR